MDQGATLLGQSVFACVDRVSLVDPVLARLIQPTTRGYQSRGWARSRTFLRRLLRFGYGPSATLLDPRFLVANGGIVLQNSFLGCVKNFLGSLMRSPGNYVGGHMIDPISNREFS